MVSSVGQEASIIARVLEPRLPKEQQPRTFARYETALDECLFDEECPHLLEVKDRGLFGNVRLTMDDVLLPKAVIENLGYEGVRTVGDWVRKLPVASRINWGEDPCWLKTGAFTTAIPCTTRTSRVALKTFGKFHEHWIYLTYSPDGSNIGEGVYIFNYGSMFYPVTGRLAEQNKYPAQEGRNFLDKQATIVPLQELHNDEAVAKASFVTIGICLYEENRESDRYDEVIERENRRRRFSTCPTDAYRGFLGYDGKFAISRYSSFIMGVTAVGVDASTATDIAAYTDTIGKRLDEASADAANLLFGPSVEKVRQLMLGKVHFPLQHQPNVFLARQLQLVCLDYTGRAGSELYGKTILMRTGSICGLPLVDDIPKQEGMWLENYPVLVRFATEDDKHLASEQRLISVYCYDSKKQIYTERKITPCVQTVDLDAMQAAFAGITIKK